MKIGKILSGIGLSFFGFLGLFLPTFTLYYAKYSYYGGLTEST